MLVVHEGDADEKEEAEEDEKVEEETRSLWSAPPYLPSRRWESPLLERSNCGGLFRTFKPSCLLTAGPHITSPTTV